MAVLANAGPSSAEESPSATAGLQPIALPRPEKDGGKSVLAALQDRRTNRNISASNSPRSYSRIYSGQPLA